MPLREDTGRTLLHPTPESSREPHSVGEEEEEGGEDEGWEHSCHAPASTLYVGKYCGGGLCHDTNAAPSACEHASSSAACIVLHDSSAASPPAPPDRICSNVWLSMFLLNLRTGPSNLFKKTNPPANTSAIKVKHSHQRLPSREQEYQRAAAGSSCIRWLAQIVALRSTIKSRWIAHLLHFQFSTLS